MTYSVMRQITATKAIDSPPRDQMGRILGAGPRARGAGGQQCGGIDRPPPRLPGPTPPRLCTPGTLAFECLTPMDGLLLKVCRTGPKIPGSVERLNGNKRDAEKVYLKKFFKYRGILKTVNSG